MLSSMILKINLKAGCNYKVEKVKWGMDTLEMTLPSQHSFINFTCWKKVSNNFSANVLTHDLKIFDNSKRLYESY